MEPENHPVEKENHLPNLHLWVLFKFSEAFCWWFKLTHLSKICSDLSLDHPEGFWMKTMKTCIQKLFETTI